jgi:hypothetical protein
MYHLVNDLEGANFIFKDKKDAIELIETIL